MPPSSSVERSRQTRDDSPEDRRDGGPAIASGRTRIARRIVEVGGWTMVVAAFSLVLAEGTARLVPRRLLYGRDHEILLRWDGGRSLWRYAPNADLDVLMEGGDLLRHLQRGQGVDLEPRRVRFRTDEVGFRNGRAEAGGDILLMGGSFVVGNGIPEEEALGAQLERRSARPLRFSNASFPGWTEDRDAYLRLADRGRGARSRIVVFLFEGTDFAEASGSPAEVGWPRTSLTAAKRQLRRSEAWRFARTEIWRLRARLSDPGSPPVLVRRIAGRRVGFLRPYVDVTEKTSYAGSPALESFLARHRDRIVHVYFVPTKWRVYSRWVAARGAPRLPHARWAYLATIAQGLDLPATDLTPALEAEAARLLEQSLLVYWSDDTHWNGFGTAAAAEVVCEQLDRELP